MLGLQVRDGICCLKSGKETKECGVNNEMVKTIVDDVVQKKEGQVQHLGASLRVVGRISGGRSQTQNGDGAGRGAETARFLNQ